ncbi:MAG: DUF424 family protein [Candidatus Micrarchaeales archaeon]|jgi:hypothetical protein|uniref:DUF424 domain-containing protein n=1 Tax=Candidatus Micrarchaeum acidiphilum ARMAN-2 TaxID=425595 RepID=C7DIQ3_MICA2|nr:MAG: Protein of unknown function DUF424 [Candidatus Micrarchaeum acidiphilum ARMAN-2]MCW6161597.1 DUF424 family protein [Candidatus Micrarchaeales archaeon]
MIYYKEHVLEEGVIIAICDENLIDKVLEDGDLFIDVASYSDFYKGELIDPNAEVKLNLREFDSANVIGSESVAFAIKNFLIGKDNVKMVGEVPYAQSYKVKKQ